MTTKTTGVIAAGFLAIGIVVGAAGTIVSRDAMTPDLTGSMGDMAGMMGAGSIGAGSMGAGSMGDMAGMMSMMGAGSMGDMAGMMSMMGAGSMGDMAGMMSMMGAGSKVSPGPSMSPQDHGSHHASPSPAGTR